MQMEWARVGWYEPGKSKNFGILGKRKIFSPQNAFLPFLLCFLCWTVDEVEVTFDPDNIHIWNLCVLPNYIIRKRLTLLLLALVCFPCTKWIFYFSFSPFSTSPSLSTPLSYCSFLSLLFSKIISADVRSLWYDL